MRSVGPPGPGQGGEDGLELAMVAYVGDIGERLTGHAVVLLCDLSDREYEMDAAVRGMMIRSPGQGASCWLLTTKRRQKERGKTGGQLSFERTKDGISPQDVLFGSADHELVTPGGRLP